MRIWDEVGKPNGIASLCLVGSWAAMLLFWFGGLDAEQRAFLLLLATLLFGGCAGSLYANRGRREGRR